MVAKRARRAVYRPVVWWHMRTFQRGTRDRCWCGGQLLRFKWHRSYGVCAECGCYVNRRPLLREELARLYSFGLYWHIRQKVKGNPPIERRPETDRADGRIDYWLGLVQRYCAPGARVIEVGCGHGVLLAELAQRGYRRIGVEVDEKVAAWVRDNMNVEVRAGLFPGVDLPDCDLFLALDVIERSPSPDEFMGAAAGLLRPGGAAIIQTPIDRYDYLPPFGDMCHRVFDEVEHMYVFTPQSIRRLGEMAGLVTTAEDRWHLAHEIAVLARE